MHQPGDKARIIAHAAFTIIAVALLANLLVFITEYVGYSLRLDTAYIAAAAVIFVSGIVWYYGRRDDDD